MGADYTLVLIDGKRQNNNGDIYPNSFGGNRHRLKLHQAQDRVAELNRAAARVAREVADAAPRPVLVAGSMGPTGELIVPLGPLTMEEAAAAFAEQARALAEGGVDLLWIETMSSAEEVEAAVLRGAAGRLALLYLPTYSPRGRLLTAAAAQMDRAPAALDGSTRSSPSGRTASAPWSSRRASSPAPNSNSVYAPPTARRCSSPSHNSSPDHARTLTMVIVVGKT